MEDYVKCLERQDEIFEVAMDRIRAKAGEGLGDLKDPSVIITNIPAVNARKADILPYLEAAEKLITFQVDKTPKEDAEYDETKLQEIRDEKTPLSLLLLFPAKLSNLLINALANIFVTFKVNKAALLQSDAAVPILAAQYEGYAESLAYTLTARPLRDGFFLNQGINDFKSEIQSDAPGGEKFWPTFVRALFDNKDVADVAALFRHDGKGEAGCTHRLREGTTSWGKIAADVFRFHELQPEGDILSQFAEECTLDPELTEDDFKFIPNRALLDVPVRGTSLKKLMSNMNDTTLQFILQLSYSIKKAIKAEVAAVTE